MPKKMDEVFGLKEVTEQRVPLFKALVAEWLGLLILVFFGCGTANGVAAGLSPGWDKGEGGRSVGLPAQFVTCVALAFGLAIAGTAQVMFFLNNPYFNFSSKAFVNIV